MSALRPAVARRLLRAAETTAAAKAADRPTAVAYLHTVMCQCVLPYRNPGDDVRDWVKTNGSSELGITAGHTVNRRTGMLEPAGLPYGIKSRLILAIINAKATRQQNPRVTIGSGVRAFTREITLKDEGRNTNDVKEQIGRLAAASITLKTLTDGRVVLTYGRIVDRIELWDDGHKEQHALWPSSVTLGAAYFESLMEHAVPLNVAALAALASAPLRLDVYAWLAQRLHRIDPRKPYSLPWSQLMNQFGEGYDEIRQFRRRFRGALAAVKTQYPAARIEDPGGIHELVLHHSPPPVPPRTIILLGGG